MITNLCRRTSQVRSLSNRHRSLSGLEHLEDRRLLAAGDLDLLFGAGGTVITPIPSAPDKGAGTAVAVQTDGKIVAAGFAGSSVTGGVAADNDFVLTRYQPDGTLDTSFGTGGIVETDVFQRDGFLRDLLLDASGRIIVAGGNERFVLGRYNTDGSLDTTFDGDGLSYDGGISGSSARGIRAIALQPDGKIVAAGRVFGASAGNFTVLRYNSDATLDSSFGSGGRVEVDFGGDEEPRGVAIDSLGRIVVVGNSFDSSTSKTVIAAARFDSSGALDTSFDGDGLLTVDITGDHERAEDVAIDANDSMVIAGFSSGVSGSSANLTLVRVDASGTLDSTFDGDGVAQEPGSGFAGLRAVQIQPDGKLVAVGGDGDALVSRWNIDGSPDTSFAGTGSTTTNISASVTAWNAVALSTAGDIVTVGVNANFDGDLSPSNVLAVGRYEGFDAVCLSAPSGLTGWWHGDNSATDLAADNDGLLIGDTSYGTGNVEQAFYFDGDGDRVEIAENGTSDLDGFTEFTISAWVNAADLLPDPSGAASSNSIVSKYDSTDPNGTSYGFSVLGDGRFQLAVFDSGGDLRGVSDDPFVNLGEWIHLAGTWRGGTQFELYVNGVGVPLSTSTSGSPSGVMSNNSTPVTIGGVESLSGSFTGPAAFFSGLIDEVQIFDRGLGASEVQSIVFAASNGLCKPQTPEISDQSFDIDENDTLVGTVVATDQDLPHDILSFALTGNGPDDTAFAISSTGELSFQSAPNFEAPTNLGGDPADNTYVVEVEVTDSTFLSATALITVNVQPVNEFAPDFTSANFGSIMENTTLAKRLTAADLDATDSLTYSIGGTGTDDALFQVSSVSDRLLFLTAPSHASPGDANGDNIYEVDVAVSDGVNTTTQTVLITVVSANDLIAGASDPNFGTSGTVTTPLPGGRPLGAGTSMVQQADGKLVVAGFTGESDNSDFDFVIARYNSDGSLDSSFGTGGVVATDVPFDGNRDGKIFDVAIDDQDRIVVGGGNSHFVLARYLSDGTLDTSFSGDGFATISNFAFGRTISVQPDGKILIGGVRASDFAVARANPDGSLDTTFGTNGVVTIDFGGAFEGIRGMTLDASGRIVVVGDSTNTVPTTDQRIAVARFLADGTLDPSFNSDGQLILDLPGESESAFDVEIDTNGRIVLTGFAANTQIVARLLDDGSLDNGFDVDGVAYASDFGFFRRLSALEIQPDGKILTVGSNGSAFVIRWNDDGSLDASFGDGGYTAASQTNITGAIQAWNDVVLTSSGDIIAAGVNFNQNGDSAPNNIFALAKYFGDNFAPTISAQTLSVDEGTTLVGTVAATDADLPDDTLVFSLTGAGPDDATFSIDPTGELSFLTAPDFENPVDIGGMAGDNVYLVEVQVADNRGEVGTAVVEVAVSDLGGTVALEPGAYSGGYAVPGQTGSLSGPANVNLDPGTYILAVGAGPSFEFTVNDAGEVNSNNVVAASTSGNTLTLNTTTIVVDPVDYTGQYSVTSVANDLQVNPGPQSVTVVPNLDNYRLNIPFSNTPFDVDASGNVTSSNPAAMSASGNTLTFQTTTMGINPGGYSGQYNIGNVANLLSGQQNVVLVNNLAAYELQVDGQSQTFGLDATGVPSLSLLSFSVGGQTETFELCTGYCNVVIDPGAYTGGYAISGQGGFQGAATLDLAPGTYNAVIGGSAVFQFEVDAFSNVTSSNLAAASASENVLAFANTTIVVDPSDYQGQYGVASVANDLQANPGPQNVVVVPNLSGYRLQVPGGNTPFDVDALGNVTSSDTVVMQGLGNTLTLQTTTINVDPVDYTGQYGVANVDNDLQANPGPQSVVVLPNLNSYRVRTPGGDVVFAVDVNGNVTSTDPLAMQAAGDTLTLQTATITVDPGSYTGSYNVGNIANILSGEQAVVLVKNLDDYELQVSGQEQDFAVDAAGVPQPSNLIFDVGGQLENFMLCAGTCPAPPEIDPQQFNAAENQTSVGNVIATDPNLPDDTLSFSITGNGPDDSAFVIDSTGVLSFAVAPDFENPTDIGGTIGDNIYLVEVEVEDAAGQIDAALMAVEVLNEGGVVTIDPDAFAGFYNLPGLGGAAQFGTQSFDLDPGTYSVRIGNALGADIFFTVDATGDVTSTSNPDAVQATNNMLVFNNVNVTVDPVNYSGFYSDLGYSTNFTGVNDIVLVPNLSHKLRIGNPLGEEILFFLDAAGNVGQTSNPDAVQIVNNALTFNNATIEIKPDVLTAQYGVDGVIDFGATGSTTSVVVPNLDYKLRIPVGVIETFSVDSAGVPTPGTLLTNDGTQDVLFELCADACVSNVAPAIDSVSVDPTVHENESADLSISFSDPDLADVHTVRVDWGDGTIETLTLAVGERSLDLSHQYLDDNPSGTASDLIDIEITVTDAAGESDVAGSTTLVNNVAPVIVAPTGPTQALRGELVQLLGSFTDQGTLDTHSINWEVTGPNATVVTTAANLQVDFTPVELGTYTAVLTITDDDGGTAVQAFNVDVGLALVRPKVGDPTNNELVVAGSDLDEKILVNIDDVDPNVTIVSLEERDSGLVTQLVFTEVIDCIHIRAEGGDDFVAISANITAPATVLGGDGDDLVFGGSGDDQLFGEAGNDFLLGRRGDDTLYGGVGDDRLKGHRGADLLFGGDGDDKLAGGRDEDELHGGAGHDIMWGQVGEDLLYGGDGNDILFGGNGDDTLYGDDGDDWLNGGNGDDTIYGGNGNDVLFGGHGDDMMFGDDGSDLLFGGAGDDVMAGGDGDDFLFGGPGADLLDGGDGLDLVFQSWGWVWC